MSRKHMHTGKLHGHCILKIEVTGFYSLFSLYSRLGIDLIEVITFRQC